jgi:hypothetical protein
MTTGRINQVALSIWSQHPPQWLGTASITNHRCSAYAQCVGASSPTHLKAELGPHVFRVYSDFNLTSLTQTRHLHHKQQSDSATAKCLHSSPTLNRLPARGSTLDRKQALHSRLWYSSGVGRSITKGGPNSPAQAHIGREMQ